MRMRIARSRPEGESPSRQRRRAPAELNLCLYAAYWLTRRRPAEGVPESCRRRQVLGLTSLSALTSLLQDSPSAASSWSRVQRFGLSGQGEPPGEPATITETAAPAQRSAWHSQSAHITPTERPVVANVTHRCPRRNCVARAVLAG
jgi:hypothetical protein